LPTNQALKIPSLKRLSVMRTEIPSTMACTK